MVPGCVGGVGVEVVAPTKMKFAMPEELKDPPELDGVLEGRRRRGQASPRQSWRRLHHGHGRTQVRSTRSPRAPPPRAPARAGPRTSRTGASRRRNAAAASSGRQASSGGGGATSWSSARTPRGTPACCTEARTDLREARRRGKKTRTGAGQSRWSTENRTAVATTAARTARVYAIDRVKRDLGASRGRRRGDARRARAGGTRPNADWDRLCAF